MKYLTALAVSALAAIASALPAPEAAPQSPPGFPTAPNTVYVQLDNNGFTPNKLTVHTGEIIIFAVEGPNAHGVSQSDGTVCTFKQGGLVFPPTKNPTGQLIQTTYPYTVPPNFQGITFFDPTSVNPKGCNSVYLSPN